MKEVEDYKQRCWQCSQVSEVVVTCVSGCFHESFSRIEIRFLQEKSLLTAKSFSLYLIKNGFSVLRDTQMTMGSWQGARLCVCVIL